MPRFPWVRPQRARSTRKPNADSPGASSSYYGLLPNRLFNDEASRNRAELEPIDNLTRSTTPHAAHVTIAIGALAIAVAAWLTLGRVDHSLWLTGKLVDADAATATQGLRPGDIIRIETEVRPPDVDLLLAGRKVLLFTSTSTDTFVAGTVRHIHVLTHASLDGPNATVRLDIEHDPSSPLVPPDSHDYRLRIPIGTQRPLEMLLGFAKTRSAREP
ncbi:MAG: hypothetical protein OXI79_05170 [Gammaproteobacteria bacterium]|nr:hypothetical protein [Gammaproteobacteria bacterium]